LKESKLDLGQVQTTTPKCEKLFGGELVGKPLYVLMKLYYVKTKTFMPMIFPSFVKILKLFISVI